MVTAFTTLPAFPPSELNTTDTILIYTAVETMRNVHDEVDAADPSSAARHHRRAGEGLLDAQVGEPQDLIHRCPAVAADNRSGCGVDARCGVTGVGQRASRKVMTASTRR
jgi:hypothetical protein